MKKIDHLPQLFKGFYEMVLEYRPINIHFKKEKSKKLHKFEYTSEATIKKLLIEAKKYFPDSKPETKIICPFISYCKSIFNSMDTHSVKKDICLFGLRHKLPNHAVELCLDCINNTSPNLLVPMKFTNYIVLQKTFKILGASERNREKDREIYKSDIRTTCVIGCLPQNICIICNRQAGKLGLFCVGCTARTLQLMYEEYYKKFPLYGLVEITDTKDIIQRSKWFPCATENCKGKRRSIVVEKICKDCQLTFLEEAHSKICYKPKTDTEKQISVSPKLFLPFSLRENAPTGHKIKSHSDSDFTDIKKVINHTVPISNESRTKYEMNEILIEIIETFPSIKKILELYDRKWLSEIKISGKLISDERLDAAIGTTFHCAPTIRYLKD